MKLIIRLCALAMLLLPCMNNAEFTLTGVSFFSPRSQSVNAARDISGTHRFTNRFNASSWYGYFAITPMYGRAFKTRRIAEYFFNTDTITISGSLTNNRNDNDILADYFGLSPNFASTVTIVPRTQVAQVDFSWYTGWDNFYFTVHAPIVNARYQLALNEIITQSGADTPFPAGYMAPAAFNSPFTSFTDAIKGVRPFGDVKTGLLFGRINCGQSITKLSDIQVAIGWNFINTENGHLGLNLRASAPTGNRSTAHFLFEPIVGNGKHWELGLGITGKIMVWEADGEQQVAYLFLEANGTTLLASCQQRSFDLCPNGFGSRYTLLKEFSDGVYTGILHPTINKTTLPTRVSVDAQFDIVAMLGYQYRGFGIDIGYNAWMRTHEKITVTGSIPENTYAFKGIQNVFDTMTLLPDNNTQSTATLHGNTLSVMEQILTADTTPIFLSNCNINPCSASAPFAITHKLFIHIGYAWVENLAAHIQPFFGLGFEAEFEGSHPRELQASKNTMSQWNVWLKTGIAY